MIRGEISEEYRTEGRSVYRRNVGLGQLAGVGTLLMNHKKDLEYSAIAQSVVSLFCFPITEIKEIISQKPTLEQALYLEVFMLQVNIEPEIKNQLSISEAEWGKKRHLTAFKKLAKEEHIEISNCQVVVAYGRAYYKDKEYHRGYFVLGGDPMKVVGPAKLYTIATRQTEEEPKEEDGMRKISRSSLVRKSSSSIKSGKEKQDSILKRTLYNRY